jgi:hypothetical protein
VDINKDGNMDIISGSWPGEIFLFKGGPDRTFSAPEMIKDKDGNIINIEGGPRKDDIMMNGRKYTLIAGTTTREETDEGHFVIYHGQRFKSTNENPIATTGTASTAHLTDWDSDGDYDLIVGTINGKVYLIPNEGTPESYAFGKEREIASVTSRAGPCAADWDGDGDLDLLVGADDGSVSLFENTGSANIPKLASAVKLVPSVERIMSTQAPKEVCRGSRSKICVADWNGDGRLDLLVGDFAMQKPDLPEPTDEEKAEYDRIRKELEPIEQRYGQLIQKINGPTLNISKEEIDKIQKEMSKIGSTMSELRSKLPSEYERHGWVWLFLRKEI